MIKAPRAAQPLGSSARERNILFLGTCQVAPLSEAAGRFGHVSKHMLYEAYSYSANPEIEITDFDASVVALTLRHILLEIFGGNYPASDLVFARLRNNNDAADLLSQCIELIKKQLDKLHDVLKKRPVFFMSFFEPSINYLGNLVGRFELANPSCFLRELNKSLFNLLKEYNNFYYMETNEILNAVGRIHLQDDVTLCGVHASFIADVYLDLDASRLQPSIGNVESFQTPEFLSLFAEVFWRDLSNNLKILNQDEPVKIVIVDLDDTIWRGVAAEENFEVWRHTEGWPIGFVEALLFFKKRGGLLAVCSKNDYEVATDRIAAIWRGALSINDFVSLKISWQPKSEAITEILREVNLLPQNALFIDDNPREIAEVKVKFPQLRCLSDNHYDWRRTLLCAPELQAPVLTDESEQRTELTRAGMERLQLAQTLSREDWLNSLEIKQTITQIEPSNSKLWARAMELLNKTNQFNTTGKRWPQNEFESFVMNGGICLVATLKDKIMDNGLIAVALIDQNEITQVVLSCRVFNLGAELALGAVATNLALKRGQNAVGAIVDTGKNFACHNYFDRLGFVAEEGRLVATRPCETPAWIELSIDGITD